MRILPAWLPGVMVAAQSPDADAVRDRLNTCLLEYEPELGTLVAEEHLTQRDAPDRNASVTAAPDTKHRRLISEVAFIGLPGGSGWLGFRRVLNLNGKDLPDAREEFLAGRFRDGTGTARYSNYRRFQTGARIVPPPGR